MKFNIITLGCKVNTYESNFMKESLCSNGFSFCDEAKSADIIIINTCTVTDTSDKKSLKMVRRARKENPRAILVICGCSVQNDKEKYNNIDIDIMLGNKDKSKIVSIINEYIKTHQKYTYIEKKRDLPFEDMMITRFNQVRAYLKIQDGCNNFCSYCVIPFVRGSVRSKDFDTLLKEANTLVNNGYQEIVLTGIHTGAYNSDGKDLSDVIYALSQIPALKRIRLSSIEVTELDDKFLNLLKTCDKLCSHLHIPLQAGSDEILKVMRRKYDTAYFLEKINKIREIRPEISITTDVIVGHNYETEKLFLDTLEFCKKIQFAKIHVFPYSKREFTLSSKMPCEVNPCDIKKRSHMLLELSDSLEKEYYNKFKGRKMDVLIETSGEKSIGHTSNYLKVEIDEVLDVNKIYKREI